MTPEALNDFLTSQSQLFGYGIFGLLLNTAALLINVFTWVFLGPMLLAWIISKVVKKRRSRFRK